MKNYEGYRADNRISSKMARDLARLLDNPLFAVNPKDGHYGVPEVRQRVYNRFCRACLDAGVALPPLEEALIECHLPQGLSKKDIAAGKAVAEKITGRIKGNSRLAEAKACRAIAGIFLAFPNLTEWGSVDKGSLVAMANKNLLAMGVEPVRPEYQPLPEPGAAPPKPLRILLVDDDAGEILNTSLSLAGWPDVEVQWVHQKMEGYSPAQAEVDKAMSELVQAIADSNCEVVFMDEGLRNLDGHDVVKKAKQAGIKAIFVANTGGNADDLLNAGCIASANKGEKIRDAMRTVSRYLS